MYNRKFEKTFPLWQTFLNNLFFSESMKRIGGSRRKTRYISRKHYSQKGKVSFKHYFQSFKDGEKVLLQWDSGVSKGMYFPRFYGKSGVIKGKRGQCYEIQFLDGKKDKTLIAHPVHLRRIPA